MRRAGVPPAAGGCPARLLFALIVALPLDAATLVFRHVNVVRTSGVMRDMRVTIAGNRITSIRKDNAKPLPHGIDASGKFLIPGLWDMHVHLGAGFFKVHDSLPRASYFAVMDEAKRLGLPVAGHVPQSVTSAEASKAGRRSMEHLTRVDAKDAALFRKNHTWQCPTLIMRHNYARLDDATMAGDPRLAYVKPSWRERWLSMTRSAAQTPASEWMKRREIIRGENALVATLQQAGVGILAGTDTSNPYVMPGFSLHDELALLVGADLVLLDANPLDDIRNTTRIAAVVLDGRLYARAELDDMLAGAAR